MAREIICLSITLRGVLRMDGGILSLAITLVRVIAIIPKSPGTYRKLNPGRPAAGHHLLRGLLRGGAVVRSSVFQQGLSRGGDGARAWGASQSI